MNTLRTLLILLICLSANIRGEVIESTPVSSLPTGPQQPQLSHSFTSVQDFMNAGNSKRLVVLTAPAWCAPCKLYQAQIGGLHSESFDAKIQVIDIDKYPRLYRLLRGNQSIPQTFWIEGNAIHRVWGSQPREWLLRTVKRNQGK